MLNVNYLKRRCIFSHFRHNHINEVSDDGNYGEQIVVSYKKSLSYAKMLIDRKLTETCFDGTILAIYVVIGKSHTGNLLCSSQNWKQLKKG